MARMIPPYYSEEVKSRGEKQIFDLFKTDPETSEWIVLHSLALTEHVKRLFGEIDFVVLAPKLGIFCLEVKSGNVERKNGIWHFTNRYGQINTKTRGPFEQAQEGMFSLLSAIKKKYGENSRYSRLVFGYGVMFPNISYQVTGTDQENWQVYDRDSKRLPVSQYIKRLAYFTQKKLSKYPWFNTEHSLPTVEDVRELANFLRGDFERRVALKDYINDVEEEIEKYTEEQYLCLDQLDGNDRCLFQGAAGTGKTMIAMESVRRSVFRKERVLFLCFNKLLAEWLKIKTSNLNKDYLMVTSFHKFLEQIAGINSENNNKDEDYFKYELPIKALEAISNGAIEPVDKIIIDEGQDLIHEEYLDIIDELVVGGLAGGKWEIYCDLERQAIYSERTPMEMLELLQRRGTFTKFRLTYNCRNTRYIGAETSAMTGFQKPPFLPGKVEGPPVQYYFYQVMEDQIETIKNILIELKRQKISPENITILSPFKYHNSSVAKLGDTFEIVDINSHGLRGNRERTYSFSTIHGYKGLENSYVILTDITRLNDPEFNHLLYIGMSRAKVGLYVLIHQEAKKTYLQLLQRSLTL
jgi:hypothetical protein